MENKKKIKRLVLKKEEIVNLNDYQMEEMKGGSSWGCVASVTAVSALSYMVSTDIYNGGKDNSWWNCDYSNQANCMSDLSQKIVQLPDGSRACEFPEINVYGYRP
ncbi:MULTISPECIES: class I lanthipeptide [unclassified Bacteroides]|uniref:class I lanthipeptide n=1 Tax=unclassified Bacteroides TaxID=2646097 RepID=UPI0013ED13B7|nr:MULTISPECIES: class I lanthipeptide [unclassified Bacteroides]QTO26232.1 class I lanthipeptide [Bacteroides sp. ZJ-18]